MRQGRVDVVDIKMSEGFDDDKKFIAIIWGIGTSSSAEAGPGSSGGDGTELCN